MMGAEVIDIASDTQGDLNNEETHDFDARPVVPDGNRQPVRAGQAGGRAQDRKEGQEEESKEDRGHRQEELTSLFIR